ncbi:hypothetical protein HWV62_41058 [Athelia sp. TMB]|nr:hypothetical protein HWV62_41058 [Athelia sp. TMB]
MQLSALVVLACAIISTARPLTSPVNEGAIAPRGIANGITQLGVAGSDAAAAVGDVGNGVFQGLAITGAGAVEAVGAGAAAAAGRRSVVRSTNFTYDDNKDTALPLSDRHSNEKRGAPGANKGIADGLKSAGDAGSAGSVAAAGVGSGISQGAATFGAGAVSAAGQGAAAGAGCVTDDEWSMPKPAVSCNAENIEQFTYHCANDKNAQGERADSDIDHEVITLNIAHLDPALMAACLAAHKCPVQESSSKGAIVLIARIVGA